MRVTTMAVMTPLMIMMMMTGILQLAIRSAVIAKGVLIEAEQQTFFQLLVK